MWSRQVSLKLSWSENVVCHAELCKPHTGTAITVCILAWLSIGHHGSRTESEECRDSFSSVSGQIQAHRLTLGRSLLLAHCTILSLQALNWASKVAAGFEFPKTNFWSQATKAVQPKAAMWWCALVNGRQLIYRENTALSQSYAATQPNIKQRCYIHGFLMVCWSLGTVIQANTNTNWATLQPALALTCCHVMSERQQDKQSWLYLLLALLGHSSHTV